MKNESFEITIKRDLLDTDQYHTFVSSFNMIPIIIGALLCLATTPFVVDALTIEDLVEVHRNHLSRSQLEELVENFQGGTYTSRHLQSNADIIKQLFANRNTIDRTVEVVYNGVVATTTSQNTDVTNLIRTHVGQMAILSSPIRQNDPLFVSLFQNIQQTRMDYVNVAGGVRVEHLATTDCGLLLVQDHADSVSNFVNTGNRRPNFSWIEPDVCASPQLIDADLSTTLMPPAVSPSAASPASAAGATTSTMPSSSIKTSSTMSSPMTDSTVAGSTTSIPSSSSVESNDPTDSPSASTTTDSGDIASIFELEKDSSCGSQNVGTVFGVLLLELWSLWCF